MTIVTIENLNKSFENVLVLKNVYLNLNPGEIIFLSGQNGSGKTTLIKCIAKLLKIDAGNIKYYSSKINYLGDKLRCYSDLTVYENIDLITSLFGNALNIANELATWNLTAKKNTLFKELSKGEQTKVALIIFFANDANCLLLDEPTAYLDQEGIKIFKSKLTNFINTNNGAAIFASHDLTNLKHIATSNLVLKDGQLLNIL